MTRRVILTTISPNLYNLLIKEKQRLCRKEIRKNKSRRKRITSYHASESIFRRAIR